MIGLARGRRRRHILGFALATTLVGSLHACQFQTERGLVAPGRTGFAIDLVTVLAPGDKDVPRAVGAPVTTPGSAIPPPMLAGEMPSIVPIVVASAPGRSAPPSASSSSSGGSGGSGGNASSPVVGEPGIPGGAAPNVPGQLAPSGASAGDSGTSFSDGVPVLGSVVELVGGQARPLAGAQVRTTDGRSVFTDSTGEFKLFGGAPTDGVYVASHPGYVASAVVGLTGIEPVHLHLRTPTLFVADPPPVVDPVPLLVQGRLVAPSGQPLAEILVVLSDARGSTSNPVLTATDGSFSLTVRAPERKVVNGTLLATSVEGTRWLGLATGIDLSAETPTIDFVPTTPASDPLELIAADHSVRVLIDGSAAGGPVSSVVDMVAPDGASVGLPGFPNNLWVAPLPGVRYALRSEAIQSAQSTESTIYRDSLPIDFGQPSTVLPETLLAPPNFFVSSPTLEPGSAITWVPVAGASGYHLSLAGLDGRGFIWEAFTPGQLLHFAVQGALAPGRYGLTLTAWDAGDMGSRQVASVPAALRLLPLSKSFRRASRQLRLSR